MKLRNVPRLTVFFLSVCHLLGGCAYACFICPNFPILGPIVQAVEKAPVVGQLVKGANDGAGAIAKGGADVLTGAVKVGVGLTKIVTGDPNGRQEIQDGLKKMGDGAIQVVASGAVVAIAAADPLIGVSFFGYPSPLQGVAKFLYETIAKWKGKPNCNPAEQIGRLMLVPKDTLDDVSRLAGLLSTPAKYLSSIFDGYGAWEVTGCDGIGIGKPVRSAQHSSDGFWTVDLSLLDFEIQGTKAPLGRYIRLEVMPGTAAHESVERHPPIPTDLIRFGGPMMWDKDADGNHPHGHMEVHPMTELVFGVAEPPPSPKPGETPPPSQPPAPPPGPSGYAVQRGDSLSKIAQQFYGSQRWPAVYCGNRAQIRKPDRIYPGQILDLPVSGPGVDQKSCRGAGRALNR